MSYQTFAQGASATQWIKVNDLDMFSNKQCITFISNIMLAEATGERLASSVLTLTSSTIHSQCTADQRCSFGSPPPRT